MSDARWFDVEADMRSAVRHFERGIELFEKGGFDRPGLDGYQASRR
jgi:hypothetical protein